MTYAEHEKKLKAPAVCELLPLRDLPNGDNVMVRTNGAFVAGYELRGILAYFATDSDRNQTKSMLEALFRSVPDVSMRIQFRYEISEHLGDLLDSYVGQQRAEQSEVMALDTHRLRMWRQKESSGFFFENRLHVYFIWDPRVHAKLYHPAQQNRQLGGFTVSQRKAIRFHAKENDIKNGGPDEYMAVDAQLAFEVLDLRAIGDCERVRLAFTDGIQLPSLASPKYLIRCADDMVVGPIELVIDSSGKAVFEKCNRARVPCYQLGEDAFLVISLTTMAAQAKVLSGNKLEQLVVRLQRHTGRPKEACWPLIIQHGIKGRKDHRRWTESELEIVREEVVKRSIEEIAKKIDRSPKAIRNVLRRNRLSLREVRLDVSGPPMVRIAKRGDFFYVWYAGADGKWQYSGTSMKLPMQGPFYVGLGVCAHDKDRVETATFSQVHLTESPTKPGTEMQGTLFSTLETVPIASTDRSVVYTAAAHFEAPNWLKDGSGFLVNEGGHIERVGKGAISVWSCDPGTNGFTTQSDYVRDQAGNQLSEFDPGSNGNLALAHTNVWANGTLIATDDNTETHFYLNDWVGTRRVQTGYQGDVEQTCSSLPYGDSETCAPTPTENLFTGKERDLESGLDNFGARYYASTMGRWMSPDYDNTGDDPEPIPYADLEGPKASISTAMWETIHCTGGIRTAIPTWFTMVRQIP
jgi:RHS repeat-associated protein